MKTAVEGEVKQVFDRWVKAVKNKDLNALREIYAPDVEGFDLKVPLRHRGIDAYMKVFEEWFNSMETINCEMRDLKIEADENLAFAGVMLRRFAFDYCSVAMVSGIHDENIQLTVGLPVPRKFSFNEVSTRTPDSIDVNFQHHGAFNCWKSHSRS